MIVLQEIALVSMVLLNRVKRVGNNIKGTADPDISFMDVMAADLYTSIKKSGYKGEKRNVVLASAVQQSESAICIHISPPWEFPGSSVGKESACSAGDPSLIPGLGMATHSSILAWRIPWREERGRLPSMGSQRVGHD